MKSGLCLFFLTMGWTAWTVGSAHAAAAKDAKPQQHATAADGPREQHRPPRTKRPHGGVAVAKASHPQPPKASARSAAGGTVSSRASNADRSRPSATLPNNMRHRSPNPATVGGPKSATAANSGAINGTHMARKP